MGEREQALSGTSLEIRSPEATGIVASPQADAPGVQLSRRERQVAVLLAQGLTNRQIGVALAIKERTVEDHVGRLLRKLHLTNRAQAILWTIANGLVVAPALTASGTMPTAEREP
jgi:DNA-binding NarL/FixJ family response regulator